LTWTEIAGFATGALCVFLVVRQNVWGFPVGIANNLFFIALFLPVGLYADAGLQVVYIALAAFGWYRWLHGGRNRSKLKVSVAPARIVVICVISVVIITAAIHFVLSKYTDSTVAGWDAVTTAISLVAQFMLNRKYLQNWFFWITADIIYIWLYAYKDLWLTSFLYLIFLLLCVAGFLQWKASLNSHEAETIQ
jgi:nicotinamide mononucleotide transporter